MSNRQYMPGSSIPTMNIQNPATGYTEMVCEACFCPQQTAPYPLRNTFLPHVAGSYDCIEAQGMRMAVLRLPQATSPELINLENKLRGEMLAANERAMKDVQEMRTDLREFISMPALTPEPPPPLVSLVISKKDISPEAMKMLEEWKTTGRLSMSFKEPVILTEGETVTVQMPPVEMP